MKNGIYLFVSILLWGSITVCNALEAEERAFATSGEKVVFMDNVKTVYYFPGFCSGDNPQTEAKDTLQKIFPGAKIIARSWKSVRTWYWAVNNTNQAAQDFVKDLLSKSPQEISQTVLVGHSLGGRIVVRILAILKEKKIKIGQAFILGAAIANDDSDIAKGTLGSHNTVHNFYYKQDWALNTIYKFMMFTESPALGCMGYSNKAGLENYNDIEVVFLQSISNADAKEDDKKELFLSKESVQTYFDYLNKEYGEYKSANAVFYSSDNGWQETPGLLQRIRERRINRRKNRLEELEQDKQREKIQVIQAGIAEYVLHDANLIYLNYMYNKKLDSITTKASMK